MSGWNFDILKAPRGRYVIKSHVSPKGAKFDTRVFVADKVILATKCGKVTVSSYIPEEKRWLMLGKGEEPIAWAAWPDHPHSQPLPSPPAAKPETEAAAVVSGTNSPETESDGYSVDPEAPKDSVDRTGRRNLEVPRNGPSQEGETRGNQGHNSPVGAA